MLLEQLFIGKGGRTSRADDSVCPVLPLPATAAEFLGSRSKNYRKKFREHALRCHRELGVTVRRTSSATELEQDMDALVALHNKRWQGSSRAFRSARYSEFHQRLARLMLAAGRLRLFSLEKDGRALALLYCFAHDRRYSFYQGGRDPDYARYRVGLVLMHNVILQAIHEGATVFDFLRGVEDYKYRWATTESRNERVRYSKAGWATAVYALSDFVFRMKRKAAWLKVPFIRNPQSR
jgi:CelD/BcsL family acetyltransferase involved in cellulose biosynthesis